MIEKPENMLQIEANKPNLQMKQQQFDVYKLEAIS